METFTSIRTLAIPCRHGITSSWGAEGLEVTRTVLSIQIEKSTLEGRGRTPPVRWVLHAFSTLPHCRHGLWACNRHCPVRVMHPPGDGQRNPWLHLLVTLSLSLTFLSTCLSRIFFSSVSFLGIIRKSRPSPILMVAQNHTMSSWSHSATCGVPVVAPPCVFSFSVCPSGVSGVQTDETLLTPPYKQLSIVSCFPLLRKTSVLVCHWNWAEKILYCVERVR